MIIMTDVETDGPAPGLYSMIELGAVVVEPGLKRTFFARLRPLEGADFQTEALKVSGSTRHGTLTYPDAAWAIQTFANWLRHLGGKHQIFSDCIAFDWQFINYYRHLYRREMNIGHRGFELGTFVPDYKEHRRQLPHNALGDAVCNAEVLQYYFERIGDRDPYSIGSVVCDQG